MDRPKPHSPTAKAPKSKVPAREGPLLGKSAERDEPTETVGKLETVARTETVANPEPVGKTETVAKTETVEPTDTVGKPETVGRTETVGQALVRAGRILDDLAVDRLKRKSPEARASHARLLPYVDAEGTRLTTLADRLGVTKQAIGQLVEELEGQGLLLREPDPDDGRAKRVKLTARGKKAMQDGLVQLGALEALLTSTLGEKRMLDLGTTLTEAIQCLEAESAKK